MPLINGDDGSNTLTGTSGADEINGLGGNDTISGLGGDDVIDGGTGSDTITGGAGNDRFVISSRGIGLVDIQDFAPGDVIDLSAIDVGSFELLQKLMYQNDSNGSVVVDLSYNNGNMVLTWLHGGSIRLVNTTLAQLSAADFVFHLRTDDQVIIGNPFSDMLWGGSGNDYISGGGSSNNPNSLFGEAGNDVLEGGGSEVGADRLYGGAGADVFTWSTLSIGTDIVMDFEAGDRIDLRGIGFSNWEQLDRRLYQGSDPTSSVIRYADGGNENSITILNYSRSSAQPSDFIFQTTTDPLSITGTSNGDLLFGALGDDAINGESGNDTIEGGDGDDTLDGGPGVDTLYGGEGNDWLAGRSGDDRIDGGSGVDTAIFAATRAEYTILRQSDGTVRVTGPDGTDALLGVERGQFSDGNFDLEAPGGPFVQAPQVASKSFGPSSSAGGWTSNNLYPRSMGDINGDGRADIVGFGAAGVYTALGQADGTFAGMSFAFNGFGANASAGGWVSNLRYPRTLGDVNGDGRDDIVGFGADGTYVALAGPGGTFNSLYRAGTGFGELASAGGWASQDRFPRVMADVNGDGRDDIVGFGGAGTYVSLAQADGTFGSHFLATSRFGTLASSGGWSSQNQYPRMLADMNGDGREDIVGFGTTGVFVALAQADGTFGSNAQVSADFGTADGWTSVEKFPRAVGDFNGDGLADIVGFGADGVLLALNNGDGTFDPAELALGTFGSSSDAGGWSSYNYYTRAVADVTGDGLADIVGFGSYATYVSETLFFP